MNPSRPFELTAFLRALFLILSAAVYTVILGPPTLVSCFLDRSRRWPSFFQSLWVEWLLRTNGIPVRVEGMENLKKDQSYILVSNHASILDIPALISAAPFPVRFLAKKSLLWFPIFGWVLHFSGHILVDRKTAQSALRGLKKAPSILISIYGHGRDRVLRGGKRTLRKDLRSCRKAFRGADMLLDKEGTAWEGSLLQAEVLWRRLLSLLPDVPSACMVPGELHILLAAHGMDEKNRHEGRGGRGP